MTGDILVINTGSSSLKYAVFRPDAGGPVRGESGQVDGIGTPHGRPASGYPAADHAAALDAAVAKLRAARPDWEPAAVGHRVVHGGTRFTAPAVLDAAT